MYKTSPSAPVTELHWFAHDAGVLAGGVLAL